MQEYEDIKRTSSSLGSDAVKAISKRLADWSGGSWLDSASAKGTQMLINSIDRSIPQAIVQRCKLEQWYCGMCQMLDLADENVCKMLPFLLTAYLYNYPFNRFVKGFLKRLDCTSGVVLSKRELLGIEVVGIEETTGAEATTGIGRLLFSNADISSKAYKNYKRQVNRFLFPQVYPTPSNYEDYEATDVMYVFPEDRLPSRLPTCTICGKKYPLFKPGLELYEKQFILSLFSAIYFVTKRQMQTHPKYYCEHTPDILSCWVSLLEALNDKVKKLNVERTLIERPGSLDKVRGVIEKEVYEFEYINKSFLKEPFGAKTLK